MMINILILSCKKADLKIYSSINKKDSVLILKIENTTNKNFLVEIPNLDNFWYKDEYDKLNPEYISQSTNVKLTKNDEDSIKFSSYKCTSLLNKKKSSKYPKFLNAKTTKKYYYKLNDYKKGRKIFLIDDDFDVLLHNLNVSQNNKPKREFIELKNQVCGGYEYFTGSFEFIHREIILP